MRLRADFLGQREVRVRKDEEVAGHPHIIEKILGRSLVQFFLREITSRKNSDYCLLKKIFSAYKEVTHLSGWPIKYFLPILFIERGDSRIRFRSKILRFSGLRDLREGEF